MNTARKILPLSRIIETVRLMRDIHRRIVLTNGCFDLLHVGHVRMLDTIHREQGERAFVIVAVNADSSVRELKGPERPVNSEEERAEVVAGLASVDCVTIFKDRRVNGLLRMIQPDVWVKGGGYTMQTLDPEELKAALDHSVDILLLPMTEGRSTTGIISKLTRSIVA
jgi:rfaE bifunctional protein nucleotidyltransferase chain/domain